MRKLDLGMALLALGFFFGSIVSECERMIFAIKENEPAPPFIPSGLLIVGLLIAIFYFIRGTD